MSAQCLFKSPHGRAQYEFLCLAAVKIMYLHVIVFRPYEDHGLGGDHEPQLLVLVMEPYQRAVFSRDCVVFCIYNERHPKESVWVYSHGQQPYEGGACRLVERQRVAAHQHIVQ